MNEADKQRWQEGMRNLLDEQKLLFHIENGPVAQLAKCVDEIEARYSISEKEFNKVLVAARVEKPAKEDAMLRLVAGLCRLVLDLPESRLPKGEGSTPRPAICEEFFARCGAWLKSLDFFPLHFIYPTPSYYSPQRQIFLFFEWDAFESTLSGYLGEVSLVPDVIPLLRPVPLWCYEQPMRAALKSQDWQIGAVDDWKNLQAIMRAIMQHYDQVGEPAMQAFQAHLSEQKR